MTTTKKKSASKKTKSQTVDFEKALGELEKIVERMEHGDQTLETSLKDFERGMELSRSCQKSLEEAELRVEKLVKKHGGYDTEPFEEDEPD